MSTGEDGIGAPGDAIDGKAFADLRLDESAPQYACLQREVPAFPAPSGAADELVLTSWTEAALGDAVAQMNAAGGGTLFIDGGDGEEHTIRLTNTLRLKKGGHYKLVVLSGTVTLDGQGQVPILFQGPRGRLEVYGLRFVNGLATGSPGGAAIHTGWRGELQLVRCHFEANRSTSDRAINGGGAVNVQGGSVSIYNCVFVGNRAPTGGAVHATTANMRVVNSVFRRNFATGGYDGREVITGHGGALRCDRLSKADPVPGLISGCEFEENGIVAQPGSKDFGGAIEVWGHGEHLPSSHELFALTRSRFVGNGVGEGSPNIVMFHGPGNVVLSDLEFVHNRSLGPIVQLGPGAARDKYTATVSNVTFDDEPGVKRCLRVRGHRAIVDGVSSHGEAVAAD